MACCRGKSLWIKEYLYDGQNIMITHGLLNVDFDGVQDTVVIPHTMGEVPTDVQVTILNTTDDALNNRVITWDATNITIVFTNPPSAATIGFSWVAFK